MSAEPSKTAESIQKPGAPVYVPDSYWNKRLEKDFSLAGVGHAGVGLAFNRWAYQVRRRVLKRVLSDFKIEIQGQKILELGFGTGFYLDLWREMGAAQVLGVDIAEIAVKAARERFALQNWRFEQGDIGAPAPFNDSAGSYGLATAFDVLFHLVEDAPWNGALDNLANSVKPGGYVLIFDKFQRKESGVSHVKRRTLATYEDALQARGLEIVELRPIFFFMNSPTDLSGLSKVAFKLAWSLSKLPYKIGRVVGLGDVFGGLMGALMYWPEIFYGRIFSSGPSTKLLLARKK